MTIHPSNIRLLESERMTDASDGGGRRTSRVIPDGVAGNIFPKVSRVDSVYGRVNLRKIYPHINTATLDVYAGAHFIVTDAPDDDRIGVLAFSTGSDFDLRTAARDRIESYVIAGPESRMALYGRQLKDSQAILVYQRVEEPLPEIGEVYAISTEVGSTTVAQQFVRVQDVSHEVRTLTDDGGDFTRRVITLKIGARLRYEFQGLAAPSRYSSVVATSAGKMRTTTVADAARYYGIKPLTAAVSSGALELTLTSVYAPILPTTQRETPLSLASISGAVHRLASGGQVTTFIGGERNAVVVLPRPVMPGSFSGALNYSSYGEYHNYTFSDDGNGGLVILPSTKVGTIAYETGVLNITVANPLVGNVSYLPSVEASQPAHTRAIPITLATRGTVYAVPLLPIPAPGTLIVDYRALGKWYRLRDDGTGELVGGDAQYGTGTVDYATGGTTITLGALPDVGSSVLLSWGSGVLYTVRTGERLGACKVKLPDTSAVRSTVSVQYIRNGVQKTATDDGAGLLKIAGVTVGKIGYTKGVVELFDIPDASTQVQIAYSVGAPLVEQFEAPARDPGDGSVTVQVAGGGLLPYSVSLRWNTDVEVYDPKVRAIPTRVDPYLVATDNGLGRMLLANDEDVGSVDYATGFVTFTPDAEVSIPVTQYGWVNISATQQQWQFIGFDYVPAAAIAPPNFNASVEYRVADDESAKLHTAAAEIVLPLTPGYVDPLVPGSVMFSHGGKTYFDRNGTIYTNMDYATGAAQAVGSVDYGSASVTLTHWEPNQNRSFAVSACLGSYGEWPAFRVDFRTAGSPLRPASLFVQCTATDGALLTGTSDQNGVITGADVDGVCDHAMGVVRIRFGAWVPATGNEAEPWYAAADVVGGMIFKPREVLPGTLRYSTVVLSNLPLDADILGLDPVRLPSDGRVPIYRPADVTVIHHTDIHDAGTPSPGEVVNVGRTGLSALWLEDADKKKLDSSLYVADLSAGTATMAADLLLAGYVPPISAKHRIEEMGLLSDVQINGQVTLTAPLLRDFPAGSQLSSALLYGDLQARATNLFDQQTWTNVWQSTVVGSGATAQYNDIDYPVEVLNNGAVTERWRINFTSPTSFQVIGENLGVIATGTTGTDLQPINQLTTLPYFTLRAAGWGAGWSVGNQLRFDTIAAAPPTWLVRTVLPGAALTGDSFDAQLRGDVD